MKVILFSEKGKDLDVLLKYLAQKVLASEEEETKILMDIEFQYNQYEVDEEGYPLQASIDFNILDIKDLK